MPLSGSQQAYLPARAGLARSAAVRSNYFATYNNRRTLNAVITINGSNVSTSVIISSLRITQALNDQPDTASFTLKPGATIPSVNQLISIGLGDTANLIFGGQISRVTHRRRMGASPAPFVDVECVDWQRLFDRRLITYEWTSTSATDIVLAIVAGWTSGFTTVNVATGQPTIDYFPCTNEKPSAAIRRLVNLMGGGGTYIDPARDLHFFPAAGETGIGAPSVPLSITNTRDNLLSFSHSNDNSQQRTYITCEGRSTTTAIAVPAGATRLPINDWTIFDLSLGGQVVRIGPQLITIDTVSPNFSGTNPPAATALAADVTAGDTSVQVADLTANGSLSLFWARVGNQVFSFTSTATVPNRLTGIPASGYGSIGSALKSGESVEYLATLTMTTIPVARTIALGAQVFPRITDEDAATETSVAAVEGGDGRHEDVIADGRLNNLGSLARVDNDLFIFAPDQLTAEWETEDMNATVGGQQVINLTTTDALSGTLTITDVDISFPVLNYLPRRHCQAGRVRLPELADITQTEST